MIIESDFAWKDHVEQKLQSLESGLGRIVNHLSLCDVLQQEDDQDDDSIHPSNEMPQATQGTHHVEKHTPHNFELVMDSDSGPAAIPGSVVSPIAVPSHEQNLADQDIVTRGVVQSKLRPSLMSIRTV